MESSLVHHIVLTTHNSRVSTRMKKLKIKKGPSRRLSLLEEIKLTEIVAQIIRVNNFRCIAYNICRDHVHILLVSNEGELTHIIQKLKSMSSRLFQKVITPSTKVTEVHKNHLWSQKFYSSHIEVWALASSHKEEYFYEPTYLDKAKLYIQRNREKHNLPFSRKLQRIIDGFVISDFDAFIDYSAPLAMNKAIENAINPLI